MLQERLLERKGKELCKDKEHHNGEREEQTEMMSIGEKIKLIRKAEGLTQKDIAELSGIPHSTICRYEKEGSDPKYFYVECILGALGYRLEIVKDD